MNKKLLVPVITLLAFLPLFGQANLPSDSVLRREAARMLMVGFRGDKIDDDSDAARYVRDLHVGGIVLFDIDLTIDGPRKIGTRNVTSKEQLTALTSKLQSYADEPLIIAYSKIFFIHDDLTKVLEYKNGKITTLPPDLYRKPILYTNTIFSYYSLFVTKDYNIYLYTERGKNTFEYKYLWSKEIKSLGNCYLHIRFVHSYLFGRIEKKHLFARQIQVYYTLS